MPKKINLVFKDEVFEVLTKLKGNDTYAQYMSNLIGNENERSLSGSEEDEAPVLEVSSEKLLSILNAINERFSLFTVMGDRLENVERALEGLAEIADSLERTAFENKESIESMKNPFNTFQDFMKENIKSGSVKQPSTSDGLQGEDGTKAGEEGYEFACPQCDGTVDENDCFCRWCAYQLMDEAGEMKAGTDYYPDYEDGSSQTPSDEYHRPPSERDSRSEWTYDITDKQHPPSGPPPGWDGDNVRVDSSGRPICPICLESMTFVHDYERWFCESCWYYAPSNFMRPVMSEFDETEPKRTASGRDARPVRSRKKWDSKKLSDLPLFKKKRDRR